MTHQTTHKRVSSKGKPFVAGSKKLTAAQKLHNFMKSLTPIERREVWNIFHKQVTGEKTKEKKIQIKPNEEYSDPKTGLWTKGKDLNKNPETVLRYKVYIETMATMGWEPSAEKSFGNQPDAEKYYNDLLKVARKDSEGSDDDLYVVLEDLSESDKQMAKIKEAKFNNGKMEDEE